MPIRTEFVDEVLPSSPTYTISGTGPGQTIDLDQTPTVAGTPLNAANINGIHADGWIKVPDAWAFADFKTISVPSGAALIYSVGDKIKLTANSVVLYATITSVSDTFLGVTGNALTNHTFSNIYYSKSNSPLGFPGKVSFTPAFTNLVIGNGVLVSYYSISTNRVSIHGSFVLGSTSSISGDVSFVPPVALSSIYKLYDATGLVSILDAGVVVFNGVAITDGANLILRVAGVSGSSVVSNPLSSTVPMTWATSDELHWKIEYFID